MRIWQERIELARQGQVEIPCMCDTWGLEPCRETFLLDDSTLDRLEHRAGPGEMGAGGTFLLLSLRCQSPTFPGDKTLEWHADYRVVRRKTAGELAGLARKG